MVPRLEAGNFGQAPRSERVFWSFVTVGLAMGVVFRISFRWI